MVNPNPVKVDPCGKTSEDLMAGRNIACVHYNGCLDQAFRKNWRGFSCQKCKVSNQEDLLTTAISRSHRDHEWENVYLQT